MEKKIISVGETELIYREVDDGLVPRQYHHDGATIVLFGGLGGMHLIWSGLVRELRSRYRFIIWDYPGLGTHERGRPAVLPDIPELATCFDQALEQLSIRQAVFGGWSLGVQVALELYRQNSDRFSRLVAICGVAGESLVGEAAGDLLRSAMRSIQKKTLSKALGHLSQRLESIDALRERLRGLEHPTRWAARLGFVDPGVDELVFDAVIRDFLAMDVTTYNHYAAASLIYDAEDVLPTIEVPVLAVAGERDRFTTVEKVQAMAQRVPNAEFFEVRGATHYLPLEYSPVLALAIDEFLRKRRLP